MQAKLTDQQLYQLYVGLGVHYRECCDRRPKLSENEIAAELLAGVRNSLEARHGAGSLQQLSPDEKLKAYQVLTTFIDASPLFRNDAAKRDDFAAQLKGGNLTIIINQYRGRCHGNNDSFYAGYMWGSMYRPWWGRGWGWGAHHSHSHSHRKEDNGSALALLAVILLVAAAAASAIIASYYLVHEIANSLDRFWHNEDWLRAGVSLMGMAVSALATSLLSTAFAAGPLTSLALAAGIASPVGVVAFSIACFTIMGAAIGSWAVNAIQSRMIKDSNPDALYPADPSRFAISASEELALSELGLDPIKVKCAISELRKQMGPVPNLDVLDGDAHAKECLDTIRALKKGKMRTLRVGDMDFDFVQRANVVPFVCEPPPADYMQDFVPVPPAPLFSSGMAGVRPLFFGRPRSAVPTAPPAPSAPLPNDGIFYAKGG